MDDNHLITICVDLQIVIVNAEYRYARSLRSTTSTYLYVQIGTRASVPSAFRRQLCGREMGS